MSLINTKVKKIGIRQVEVDTRGNEVVWKPTEKQAEMLVRGEFEILFGGSRGGGKTAAGMAWLLYDIQNPLFRALVIRRNFDDLKDWIDRAGIMYRSLGVKIAGNPPEIVFPSGAIIRTGHLKDENAYSKYVGHEYHKMIIEELTQIPSEDSYLKLIASCRSTAKGLAPQVLCTTNPGGPGHSWVKKRFVDVAPPGITYLDPITGRSRVFIPAKVQDNPYLMTNDPFYVKMLDGLPPNLRKAWRDGEWEEYEVDGAYYGSEFKDLKRSGRITTVPYDPSLRVDTWWDLGMHDYTAIWFTQVYGKEIRVIDYYENSGEGLQFYIRVLNEKRYLYGRHTAPHDITVREMTTGRSRLETARGLGIDFKVAAKLNVQDGIQAVRNILPMCWFDAKNCEDGIRALESYHKEFDEKRQVFKDSPEHDFSSHAADAFRILAVGMDTYEDYDPNFNYEATIGDEAW